MDRATESTSSSRNSAYILLKCEPGFEEHVFNSLKRTKGVVEVDQVYGSHYDIVVKIKCDGLKELNSTVWRIRRINKIRLTQTLLVGNFA
ncbi:MAG TPA: Lrp/AsnC ligand binding domain-containing protein [Nitrososphaeraceae archaeon]|nr:Lrp/AsnC ligand binding domain-containing protein [Nitrososphaeraceae archaeon]